MQLDSLSQFIKEISLIHQWVEPESALDFIYESRIKDYIKTYKEDLWALSYEHHDKRYPLIAETLEGFFEKSYSPLLFLVSNEIFFDLFISFKNKDCRFKGRSELEKILTLTTIKYGGFIRDKIYSFYNKFTKLRTRFKNEKWKINKIKRVPEIDEPIKITLDIRFAIIKRANGKCDGCSASIHEKPIDVYQLKAGEKIKFVAFCENCREENKGNIQEEPEEVDNHGESI